MALEPDKPITQYSVRIWNIENGLPANSIYAVLQTWDGYLWIGTQAGLVRFDGLQIEVYNTEKNEELKSNEIRALYEDRHGTLWIGTSSGGLTRYRGEQFKTYPISRYKTLQKIISINEDRWGNLWIGSFSKGLTCISSLSSGKLQYKTYSTDQGLPDNQVKFIYKDGNGDLWITTYKGIVKLIKPGTFQKYADNRVLPYLKTVCLYKEDTKMLRIGTFGGGLFRSKNAALTAFEKEAGVPHPNISCLYRDRMKNLWIGTEGGGLTRMKNGKSSTLASGEGLVCGSVSSIYEDREGSLWVGTLDCGLHQLRDSKFTTYTSKKGLSHDFINCIYEDRAGCLWIGTQGGLNRMNLKNGKLTTVLTTRSGLLSDDITCILEDPAGYLRIGTLGGLHRFKDGKLTTLTKKNGLSDNRIRCIYEDKQGNTWIGTDNGLNRFNINNKKFSVFTKKEGLLSNHIEVIYEDSKGRLWIGTDAGLNRFSDGKISIYNPKYLFGKNYIRCIYEDNKGVLWFGTYGGLICLQDNKTFRYTIRSGLIENRVYSILEDESGHLWLGGRNGISRVGKKELEDFSRGKIRQIQPESFNEKDGMKSAWCTGAGCRTRDGRFWFPTGKGLTVVHPHQITTNKHPPIPMIEKLIVDGEAITMKSFCGGFRGAVFSKRAPLAAGGILKLAPGKKRLEFYYTAVSFINPGKIRFKIRLTGYDDDWLEMGTMRSTVYTGLSPGNYHFEVTACNPGGEWNRTGVSFSFYLSPYFYQAAWFYVLAALLVLLAAFSLYRLRVRQLQVKKKELGQLVEIRTRDLKARTMELENAHQNLQQTKEVIQEKNRQLEEQSSKLKELDKVKSRFFANISHEFRTPLTLIMGPLERMLSQSTDRRQKKNLGMMIRNSQRLLGLINQLLELSKIQSGVMKLRVSRQNIVPFLKGIWSAFEILADKKEVELIFAAEEENIPLYFDPERIEAVACNLLMNALNVTPPGGQVKVSVREHPPGSVEISVSDTGPGIPRDQVASIFDHFYQLDGSYENQKKGFGIGLALAKEFIALHHGEIRFNSEEGRGAEFVVRLPTGKGHLEPGMIVDLSEPASPPGDQPAIAVNLVSMLDLERQEPETAPIEDSDREPPVDDQPGKEIVLVVEDSFDMRQYIKNALEPDYRVEEAVDGREGIKKAQEIIPDLIISDIIMPAVDGYELCRELKSHRHTSHVPIILLTAKAAEENIIEGLETGADDYITKPFNTTILCARVKNLINLRRHLQQTINREMTLQPTKMAVSAVDKEFMSELKAVIEKNLSEPGFNVEGLSNKLYMSHATLYRKIQALTGETPRNFIRSYRLKRGAELLKSKSGNVGDVAFEVGFSSTSYFIKCFREKFHQLPSRYQPSESESL